MKGKGEGRQKKQGEDSDWNKNLTSLKGKEKERLVKKYLRSTLCNPRRLRQPGNIIRPCFQKNKNENKKRRCLDLSAIPRKALPGQWGTLEPKLPVGAVMYLSEISLH